MSVLKDAYNGFRGLPKPAQGAIAIGTCVVLFLIGKKIWPLIFPSATQKRNNQLAKDINSEIKTHEDAGQVASFPESTYMTFANTCYEGMRYAIGDNYGAVEDTLEKMNNDLDVAKLIKAFGFRQDYVFGLPDGDPKDLFTFVESELGSDYLGLTNYRVTNINSNWKTKGITYTI